MNKLTQSHDLPRYGWLAALVLAAIFSIPASRAQPTEQTVQSRFLFIFDTSKAMKSRVEAVEKSLNSMLVTSMGGQLHAGDSIGVWTFGQSLQPRGFPLQSWNPDAAVMIASNLVKFVGAQHYANTTSFEVLQPSLNQVMQNSERLTVLIFSDGEGKISGTPFDEAINQLFKDKAAEQKRAGQPLVIVLRSQLGKYVGCTASLPPRPVNIPEFPPLPLPPPPAPKPTNTPPPAPAAVVQPLIIIGKKKPASVPPAVTNPAPVVVPVVVEPTNESAPPTNAVVLKVSAPAPTNPPPPLPESPGSGGRYSLLICAGLLGAAIALGLVFWLRPRPKDASLISRSMNERK